MGTDEKKHQMAGKVGNGQGQVPSVAHKKVHLAVHARLVYLSFGPGNSAPGRGGGCLLQLGSGRATHPPPPPHASISIDERLRRRRLAGLGRPMWGPHAPGEWAACTVEPREISRTSEVLQGFAFPHRRDFNVGEPPCCRSGTSWPRASRRARLQTHFQPHSSRCSNPPGLADSATNSTVTAYACRRSARCMIAW
jgi:hypothetical protein